MCNNGGETKEKVSKVQIWKGMQPLNDGTRGLKSNLRKSGLTIAVSLADVTIWPESNVQAFLLTVLTILVGNEATLL